MKQFADSKGNVWVISLTIDAVKRVRDLLGVNLMEPEAGDPALITRIGTDEILLCDIIFCLIKPQADEKQITDQQFGQALGGEAILLAQNAFYEEMVDFFRLRGRADRAKAMESQLKMINLAVQKVEGMIGNLDLEGEVEKVFGNSSTTLPESSE